MKRFSALSVFVLFATTGLGCKDLYPGVIQPVSQNLALADQVQKAPNPGERLPVVNAAAEEEPEPVASAPVTLENGVAKVTIVVQNGLAYSHEEIRVPAGAKKVEITLDHQGTVPVTAMGHNLVILKSGTDSQAFSAAAIQSRENGYIPADLADSMVGHTKMLGGGESDTLSFDVPPAGSYDYLCSFPGHYPLMKGKLVIES